MAACLDCGRWCPSGWWQNPATAERCGKVTCMACGSERCHSEGTGNGCCKACFFGRLPGWSFSDVPSICQYAGCVELAVYAYLPGSRKHCCKKHGDAILQRRALRASKGQSP